MLAKTVSIIIRLYHAYTIKGSSGELPFLYAKMKV